VKVLYAKSENKEEAPGSSQDDWLKENDVTSRNAAKPPRTKTKQESGQGRVDNSTFCRYFFLICRWHRHVLRESGDVPINSPEGSHPNDPLIFFHWGPLPSGFSSVFPL
jgi:hypothetical protein